MSQAEKAISVMEEGARFDRRKLKAPVFRDVAREIEAAKLIREQILALSDGDEDFAKDSVEGETDVREMLASLAAEDASDESMMDSITALIRTFQQRRERIERRAGVRRALILQGMSVAGLPTLETPAGTISVRPVPPKAIVTEEADIPASFWKQGSPSLDKRALLAALKEGPVPGASMSNGGETIAMKRV